MGDQGRTVGMVVGGVLVAVIILIISLVAISIKKLDSSEVAIRYDTFNKKLSEEPLYQGLHLATPGYSRFIVFSSVFQTLSYHRFKCRNIDGVPITTSISFQYRVQTANILDIVEQFKDEDGYETALRVVGASAIHDTCSVFNTQQFQAERGRFQDELTKGLVSKLKTLYCDVTDLQVNEITRPHDYENAIKDKESAREDIEVARNERPRVLTATETVKRQAETEAAIITSEAKSEARIMINKAKANGQGILNDYKKEAESYKQLKENNGLDNEAFLNYMGVRAIANAKNPVHVGMKGPAQTSYN